MGKIIIDNYTVVELESQQLLSINGGAPTSETSFAYDVAYIATRILLALAKGAGSVKG